MPPSASPALPALPAFSTVVRRCLVAARAHSALQRLSLALALHGALLSMPHISAPPPLGQPLSALQASYALARHASLAPGADHTSAGAAGTGAWWRRVDPFRVRAVMPHGAAGHAYPLMRAVESLLAALLRTELDGLAPSTGDATTSTSAARVRALEELAAAYRFVWSVLADNQSPAARAAAAAATAAPAALPALVGGTTGKVGQTLAFLAACTHLPSHAR